MIMRSQPANRRKALRRNLMAMNADGFSFSIMVGIGETYLPAFMLARGHGELNAALIATVPVLLGSLLQLLAPVILKRLGSHRRFVVTTASLQAVSMLLLSLLAMLPSTPAWVVFLPATLYWAAGLSTGPAWNTWVEHLVPAPIRSGFFARRSRLCHVGVLLGLISGGMLLRWSVASELTMQVFAALFAAGAVGRFVSSAMLARQTETVRVSADGYHPGQGRVAPGSRFVTPSRLRESVRMIRRPGPAARLVLFLMAVQTAVHVSGPYFNPFMLKVLNLSWVDYMGLLSLGFIGKMLSLPWAGRFANRWGADRLLWVGAVGIVPISAMWFLRQDVWFLASLQILSGLVWGCYELAMLLLFFGKIPSDRRVSVLTLYNFGNSAAMVLGTFIGAVILHSLGRNHAAYLTVFVASGCLRMVALLALPGRRRAVRRTRDAVSEFLRGTQALSGSASVTSAGPARTSGGMPVRGGMTGVAAAVSPEQHSTVLVLDADTGDQSSVARRLLDSGRGGSRRRDGAAAVRLPARVPESFHEIAPGE